MDSAKRFEKPPLNAKKAYQKPQLTRFGRQRDLTTAGATTLKQDASSGNKQRLDG
jgi:hypothetical protein